MARANRRLVDGTVDTNEEHIDMFFGGYDEEAIRIARVAPGSVSGEFVVELLVDPTGDDLQPGCGVAQCLHRTAGAARNQREGLSDG